MKSKLEFDLPKEEYDFECAINGAKYKNQLLAIECLLRKIWKHEELTDTQSELIERIRTEFYLITEDDNEY